VPERILVALLLWSCGTEHVAEDSAGSDAGAAARTTRDARAPKRAAADPWRRLLRADDAAAVSARPAQWMLGRQ